MSSDQSAGDEILVRMHGIRRNIRADVNKVVENTTQMFDWKTYVKSFPWTSIAIAATIGYLLVPRRMQVVAYDKATLENYLKTHELTAAPPAPPPPPPAKNLVSEMFKIAGTVALRVGMAYATQAGIQVLENLTNRIETPQQQKPAGARPAVKNRIN